MSCTDNKNRFGRRVIFNAWLFTCTTGFINYINLSNCSNSLSDSLWIPLNRRVTNNNARIVYNSPRIHNEMYKSFAFPRVKKRGKKSSIRLGKDLRGSQSKILLSLTIISIDKTKSQSRFGLWGIWKLSFRFRNETKCTCTYLTRYTRSSNANSFSYSKEIVDDQGLVSWSCLNSKINLSTKTSWLIR